MTRRRGIIVLLDTKTGPTIQSLLGDDHLYSTSMY